MRFSRTVSTVFSLILAAHTALPSSLLAQGPPQPDPGSPFMPYGSFHAGDIDTVDMVTGSLFLHIPLVTFPQRGGKLRVGFFVRYNPPGGGPMTGCGVAIQPDFLLQEADECSSGPNACALDYRSLVTPDGDAHPLGFLASGTAGDLLAQDASGWRVIAATTGRDKAIDTQGVRI